MKCWLMSLWYSHSYFYSTPVAGDWVDKTLQTSRVVQSIFSVQLPMPFLGEASSTKIVGDVASP